MTKKETVPPYTLLLNSDSRTFPDKMVAVFEKDTVRISRIIDGKECFSTTRIGVLDIVELLKLCIDHADDGDALVARLKD